jgi:D-serine deaminase-like pyridoxal phosphate-dependent protein
VKVRDIPTPALVVDLRAMERNIERMARYFAERHCQLRPHFKAHKTAAIARRQLAAGSCSGLTVATIGEAELIADQGVCDDVLIANEILGPGKAARAAKVAKQIDLKVAIDSDETLDDLARAARAEGTEVGVLVDVNVGLPRCGITPGEPALALAKRAASTEGIRLRGVMGYEGHVVGLEDRAEREARGAKAMQRLLDTVQMIREEGLPCQIVSAGGTGTFDITGDMDGITEVQAGSYVLMDKAYAKLGTPFGQAMWLACTVISRPKPELCVADGGLKACAVDHGNPSVKDVEGAEVMFLSDEHTSIRLAPESSIKPGDRIDLWPGHIDPTINLHDVLFAVDGDEVVEVWPVAGRGYREQRMMVEH